MRKLIAPLAGAAAAMLGTLAVTSMASRAAVTSYAEDRAAIEIVNRRARTRIELRPRGGGGRI